MSKELIFLVIPLISFCLRSRRVFFFLVALFLFQRQTLAKRFVVDFFRVNVQVYIVPHDEITQRLKIATVSCQFGFGVKDDLNTL